MLQIKECKNPALKKKRMKRKLQTRPFLDILGTMVKNWRFGVDIKCAKTTEKSSSVIVHFEIMDSKTKLDLFGYTKICLKEHLIKQN